MGAKERYEANLPGTPESRDFWWALQNEIFGIILARTNGKPEFADVQAKILGGMVDVVQILGEVSEICMPTSYDEQSDG